MIVAVNPYHLTSREAPALAAAMLAGGMVTLLPAPASGRKGAEHIASYVEFTKSWQWSLPLWRAGILKGDLAGDRPLTDMDAVHRSIRSNDEYVCLRTFLVDDRLETESDYLAALAADLLRAGPNPGLSIPVAAAVDRFAARHGALVARPVAASVAQRAEASLSTPLFSISVPLLVQADAERVLHARSLMEDALVPLRDALSDLAAAGAAPDPELLSTLRAAAANYTSLFEHRRAELLDGSIEDDVRPIDTPVTLSGVVHTADVVLRSSARAAEGMLPARRAAAPRGAIVLADPDAARPVLSLIIKPLGARR